MKVSIIIPFYDSCRHLYALLENIDKLDPRPFEVIVVDDCSPNDPSSIVQRFPNVRLAKTPVNSGPAAARNLGVAISTGELLLFLDSDCEGLDRDCVAKHIEVHAKRSGYLLSGAVEDLDLRSPLSRALNYYNWSCNIPSRNIHDIIPSLMAGTVYLSIRREDFLKVGGFDAMMRTGEDRVFFEQAKRCGLMPVIRPDMVVGHHNCGSLAATWKKFAAYGRWRVLAKRKGCLGRNPRLFPDNLYLLILMTPAIALGLGTEIIFRWFPYSKKPILYLPYFIIFGLASVLGSVGHLWDEARGRLPVIGH